MVQVKKSIVVLCLAGAVAQDPRVRQKEKNDEEQIRPGYDEVDSGMMTNKEMDLSLDAFWKALGDSGNVEDMVSTMSEVMNSPEADVFFEDPEMIMEGVRNYIGGMDLPFPADEVYQFLDSDAFKDPEFLKTMMNLGMGVLGKIAEEDATEHSGEFPFDSRDALLKRVIDFAESDAGCELVKDVPSLDEFSSLLPHNPELPRKKWNGKEKEMRPDYDEGVIGMNDELLEGVRGDSFSKKSGAVEMLELMFSEIEQVINSPEMAELFKKNKPEMLREAIVNNPRLRSVLGAVERTIEILEFSLAVDPSALKKTMNFEMKLRRNLAIGYLNKIEARVKPLIKDPAEYPQQLSDLLLHILRDDPKLQQQIPDLDVLSVEKYYEEIEHLLLETTEE